MKVTADYRNSIDFDTLLRKREKGRGTGKERHRENDEDGFESSRFLLKWRIRRQELEDIYLDVVQMKF